MTPEEFREIRGFLSEINNCRTKSHRILLIDMILKVLEKHVKKPSEEGL